MESLELIVNHVAEFSRQTTEVEVASTVGHVGVCRRRCIRSEVPRVVFGRRLSGFFDGELLIHGAVVDAAKKASKCRGALFYHESQLTSDCEDEWRIVAMARV